MTEVERDEFGNEDTNPGVSVPGVIVVRVCDLPQVCSEVVESQIVAKQLVAPARLPRRTHA